MGMNYKTTSEIEQALVHSRLFNFRRNLVVPNASWGIGLHECDLLVLSNAGYATEIEIKVSRADLARDASKRHQHHDRGNRIKYLYFAMPAAMAKHIDLVPKRAGVIIISTKGRVTVIQKPEQDVTAKPFSDSDHYKLARLGALRIWNLKEKVMKLKEEVKKTML